MRLKPKADQAIFEHPRELQFVLGGDYRKGFAVFVNFRDSSLILCPHLFAKRSEALSDMCQTLHRILKEHGIKHYNRDRREVAPHLYPGHLNVDLVKWLSQKLHFEEVVELKDAPLKL